MVKYKNFGSSSQHQTIGSFSFSSQNSQHSTKTTRTGKSSRSKSRNERSPSITRREEEDEYQDDCRDEDGSRFDPRILTNASTEEDIKEGEEESLYDMISYNGIADEHSTSVCASYSNSAGDTGETDSSAGISDSHQPQKQPKEKSRRAKLSYMGYVPVSPNTAAAMAMMERIEDSQTHRHRNSNSDSANNNSGHTAGETSGTTGSTFPSIKVDDTSTSRRRQRDYDNDSQSDEGHQRQQYNQQPSSASVTSHPTVLTDEHSAYGIREYISAAQQRELQKQEAEKQRNKKRDSATVGSSSVADHTHTDTSHESSVRPNSCTGHPVMRMMNKGKEYREQQQQQQQQQHHSYGQYNVSTRDKNAEQVFKPLSPVMASPIPQQQDQSPVKANTSAHGDGAWADNVSLLSPLTAGFSAHGMIPPSLNHPSTMMQSHWNPNNARFQHQYGQQPQQLAHNYENHVHHLHQYGQGGNFQQYSPYQQPHSPPPPPQQQQQQQQQSFQSGFFPRNPVLARQLQAFHQYHHQQEKEKQPTLPSTSAPPTTSSPRSDQSKNSFKPVNDEQNTERASLRENRASHRSKGENANDSDSQSISNSGPDGTPVMDNVKFVSPTPRRRSSPTETNGSLSSHSRVYGGSFRSGGMLDDECAPYPAGMKCQSMFANMLNTCGAIVTHGYHTDNTKTSSKEKRSNFSKVAEESIAAFLPATEHSEGGGEGAKDEAPNGISAIGSGSFAANAKKIFNAGNSMMNTLPKDFQNLTQSAAVHNVFDTFQRYNPAASPVQSEEGGGIRSALSDDPDEVEAAKEDAKMSTMSPIRQRQHFKQLRRRFNKSPYSKSNSESNQNFSPTSPKMAATKEKGSEEFKARYSRNIHTRFFSEKMENSSLADDAREPEESAGETQGTRKECQDPDGVKDEESDHSWATPKSSEEDRKEETKTSVENDPSPEAGSSEMNSAEVSTPEQESPGEKSKEDDNSLEEVLGERITGDVVMSTSSGMSDSLVGSDVGDDEDPQQLDIMINSHSEDERQECAESNEIEESEEGNERDDQHLVLNAYDHNDFRHTPLHVIEEESDEEETTVKSVQSKPDDGIDTLVNDHQVGPSPSDEMSIGEDVEKAEGRPMFSVIGILRILFVTALVLQCGTVVALWDQIEDRIRAVEGGSEALTAAEDVISNLRASGESLVTAARGIIDVEKLDVSVENIFSEIELRTAALMVTANDLMEEFIAPKTTEKENKDDDKPTQEEQLFRQLVDDAFLSDDAIVDESVWSDDEEIVSTDDFIEVQLKEEAVIQQTEQIS